MSFYVTLQEGEVLFYATEIGSWTFDPGNLLGRGRVIQFDSTGKALDFIRQKISVREEFVRHSISRDGWTWWNCNCQTIHVGNEVRHFITRPWLVSARGATRTVHRVAVETYKINPIESLPKPSGLCVLGGLVR